VTKIPTEWRDALRRPKDGHMAAKGKFVMGMDHEYAPVVAQIAPMVPDGELMAQLMAGSNEMFRSLAAIRQVCRQALEQPEADRDDLLAAIIETCTAALPLPTLGEAQEAKAATVN
jgi:hypothetical protein